MGFVYAAMFFLVGLILIFRMGKENKIFYFAGGIFLFMGIWWLLNELLEQTLFHGMWGWVFRGVMAVALVIFGLTYWKERKKSASGQNGDQK